MTITETRKKCEELQKQIDVIKEEYFGAEGYAEYVRKQKIKPLWEEWNKLQILITKTENETELIK